MSDLHAALDRLRQRREAIRASATAPAVNPARAIVVGSRVFDPVSGHDGTVTTLGPKKGVSIGAVAIALEDGSTVTRTPAELILRPPRT